MAEINPEHYRDLNAVPGSARRGRARPDAMNWPVNLTVGGGRVIPPPTVVKQSRLWEAASYFISSVLGFWMGVSAPFLAESPMVRVLGTVGVLLASGVLYVVQGLLWAVTGRFGSTNVGQYSVALGMALLGLLTCYVGQLLLPARWRRHRILRLVPLLVVFVSLGVFLGANA